MPKTLQELFRDAQCQMRSFLEEGDVAKDQADKILEHLRRSVKAFRPDKS